MTQPERFVAYLRVSTAKQGKSGLGLAAQKQMVQEYLARSGGELVLAEFVEVESGKKAGRPVLQEAIQHAKKHRALLLVAKLDRLARNVAFVSSLQQAGIQFRAADMPEANEFMVHVLSAVAEYERKLISERTKAGLEQAKERGVVLGNRTLIEEGHAARWNTKQQEAAVMAAERMRLVIVDLMEKGLRSYTAIARHLNASGYKTEGGGRYYPQTVKRIIGRLGQTG